jgi:hypothetical protein
MQPFAWLGSIRQHLEVMEECPGRGPRATTREHPVFTVVPVLEYRGMLLLSCCVRACTPVWALTGLDHSSANRKAGSGVTNVTMSAIV